MSNLKMIKEHKTVMPDMTIFMNLMVVLIPMLLVTAEFAKIATLTIALPNSGTQCNTSSDLRVENNLLKLTAIVSDSTLTLASSGTVLPSYYYISEQGEKHTSVTMIAVDEKGEILEGFFDTQGNLMTDSKGNPVTSLNVNDTVVVAGNPTKIQLVAVVENYQKGSISLTDLLEAKLTMIHSLHENVEDRDQFTVAPQETVYYDKLVQLVDAANSAGYSQVSFSRLRHQQARAE